MKPPRVLSAAMVVALSIVSQGVFAREYYRQRDNATEPSALETFNRSVKAKISSDMKKLNDGTKRFFVRTRDALTWKKPAPKKKPSNPYLPWIRAPREPEKKSWLSSLFRRAEPKPIRTMDDWWELKRMDP